MLVALTKFEEELSEYLEKIILLTPCTVSDTYTVENLAYYTFEEVNFYRK